MNAILNSSVVRRLPRRSSCALRVCKLPQITMRQLLLWERSPGRDNLHRGQEAAPASTSFLSVSQLLATHRNIRANLRNLRMNFSGATTFILLVSLIPPAAQAGSLGRLFFTPEQRTQLESKQTRSAVVSTTASTVSAAATEEEGSTTSELMVNGIVQKHGGSRTVWINGKAQNAGNSDELTPEALPVAVPGKSQPVKVKVGQRLLLEQPAPPTPAARKPVNTGNEDD